jgi:lactate permease
MTDYALILDWFLAALPILAILVLMLRFRWGGEKAGAVGWGVALAIAAFRFGAGWQVLAYAQLKGVLLSLFVLYIIWAALLFYRVTDEAGALDAIGAGLPRLTSDRGLQALLLAWAFGAFLQGVSGFGVPVAIIAPLLMGLGFAPGAAVVIASVGHAWSITFGSLGSSFYALIAATGRHGEELAPWSAAVLGLACLGCGVGTLWAAGGRRTLRAGLAPLLLIGLAMAGGQYILVTHGLWSLGGMAAGLLGLAVGVAYARWQTSRQAPHTVGGMVTAGQAPHAVGGPVTTHPRNHAQAPHTVGGPVTVHPHNHAQAPHAVGGPVTAHPRNHAQAPPVVGGPVTAKPRMPLAWALFPYALLVAIVLVAQLILPVSNFLGQVVIRIQFPDLTTARGWVTPAEEGRTIDVFGHAGALLIYASLVTYAVFRRQRRYTPGIERRIGRAVVQRAARSSLGIAAMVGMAVTMEHAGMTHLLADGVARIAGPAFPLVAPFIGALGAFMTGSNTNSNVVFGAFQQRVATLVGVSPIIILAAQTAGGAVGSMFAPAKVIVGCSTVGLGGQEGPVLRAVMRYGLAIVAGLALATSVVIYLHMR